MKTWGWAVIFYSFFISAAAGAEVWTVELKAVEGRVTYQHGLATTVGKQSSFAGQPRVRGGGPARELIFHSFLNKPVDGYFRLDYMAELAGENRARPAFSGGRQGAAAPRQARAGRGGRRLETDTGT